MVRVMFMVMIIIMVMVRVMVKIMVKLSKFKATVFLLNWQGFFDSKKPSARLC